MTITLPQILLLFDTSVILRGGARIWVGYQRIGAGWLPETVLDELRFLSNRAPEPVKEKIARDFFRFYPSSGWRATDETMAHPALQSAAGKTLSKRARQVMLIAKCAYSLSQSHPDQLVVLVSDNQPLLQQIQALSVLNLCGVTGAALKQWSLLGKRPEAVSQACQNIQNIKMRSARPSPARSPASFAKPTTSASPVAKQAGIAEPKTRKPISPPSRRPTPDIRAASRFHAFSQGISLAISLAGFVIVGFLVWRLVQPQSFEQFWRRNNPPQLFGR